MLVTGGGGSGKTRLGREACVQMLMDGWDAGLADDQRRDGTAISRLQRPTLLVVDDADLQTGLIAALVEYLRWDDAGPPVSLLLLARAAGPWWDRLIRQQDLTGAYTVLDLDRHPVPVASRAEHFARAGAAFADAYGPQPTRAACLQGQGGLMIRRMPNRCSSTSPPCCKHSVFSQPHRPLAPRRLTRMSRCQRIIPAGWCGSGYCGPCASGNGRAGTTLACTYRSTRTCRWLTSLSR